MQRHANAIRTEETPAYDVEKIRDDFPILKRVIDGKPLIYLDNAATTQKPVQVIEAIDRYYRQTNANIYRGIYRIAEEATTAHEKARSKIADFINARDPREIIFVRGTTEGINLVAHSWGRRNIGLGDGIMLTEMEHHSNIVPWQLLTRERGASLKYVGITDDGTLLRQDFNQQLENGNVKLLAVTHVSNVLGTINPVRELIRDAHKAGARVLVDAAQSVPHMPVDVQDLDCDFLVFSGHKMCGPTGIGVVYAKHERLDEMDPYQGGGEMIREVHLYESTWKDPPYKFEAGTPDISGAIGLGTAIDYLSGIGMRNIRNHEREITEYALDRMSRVKRLDIYGPRDASTRAGVLSFNLADIHAHDMASLLDEDGIAVRSGHHCAQPLMERLNVPATTRASFYLYNTRHEVDLLAASLERAGKVFKI
ncbi:MAG TPA: cysteine desulfurase [Candidatus Bathyarchaeia archaeon]|nr:cysteine desulfurase [Candidatus Bathyarchaeia archaeon]